MKNIRRGEIYYADLDPIVGSEQGGTRPVLILQNNIGNKLSPTVITAPITGRKKKKLLPTHVNITTTELPQYSTILLEQIRTIDKQRIFEYVGNLSKEQMNRVEQAIDISFGMMYLGELK